MNTKRAIHILLVEDNETDIKIILRALEKNNLACTVQSVRDGEIALEYLLRKGQYADKVEFPDPDIILLDVHMPRMDGHTFVKCIRGIDTVGEVPIVVFTKKEGFKEAFRIEGVDDYISKSIDGKDMVDKIKEIIKFKKEFFDD